MDISGLCKVFFIYLLDSTLLASRFLTGRRKPANPKVLIVQLGAIGDFILWLDAARALREKYPSGEFEITLICNNLWCEIVEEMDIFDDVWPLDKKRFLDEPIYRLEMNSKVIDSGFSIVLHPVYSREFCFGDSIVRVSGASARIGFSGDTANTSSMAKRITDRWYTKLISSQVEELHELYRNAEFINALTFENRRPSWPKLDLQFSLPKGFMSAKYCVIAPGAGEDYRQWPIDFFAEVAKKIKQKFALDIVVCGAGAESLLGEKLADLNGNYIHNWIGETSLKEMVAIIQRSEFVISNETGVIHIASAVGVESVCILGGGHYGRFMPYPDKERSVLGAAPEAVYKPMDCYKCNWQCIYSVPDGVAVPCIQGVEVDSVWDAINRIYEQRDLNS